MFRGNNNGKCDEVDGDDYDNEFTAGTAVYGSGYSNQYNS